MSQQENQEQGKKMFCIMCGGEIDSDSQFCFLCGAPQWEVPTMPAEQGTSVGQGMPMEQGMPTALQNQQGIYIPSPVPKPRRKLDMKGIIIAVFLGLMTIAAAVVIWCIWFDISFHFFNNRLQNEEDNNPSIRLADNTLMQVNDSWHDEGVLGSGINKDSIITVTFLDSLNGMSDNAWDVSANGDGQVMAWTEPRNDGYYDLYIGGEGGVIAHPDSSYLFYNYKNVKQIQMNGNFHTENTVNMSYMFNGCEGLTSVDLSGFDTSNVTDLGSMFAFCENLTRVDVSGFDTANVTNMSLMFAGCYGLVGIYVSSFTPDQIATMNIPSDTTIYWMEAGSSHNRVWAEKKPWSDNILMKVEHTVSEAESKVFGSNIATNRIKTVTFLDSLVGMPDDAWDVSVNRSGKVMAWIETRDDEYYDLYIGGEGGVTAHKNSRYLFQYYKNVEQIQMNGSFHTENVTDMSGMFCYCDSLTSLDLSGFDTSNVKDMYFMFFGCKNLTSVNLSGFDTSNVTNMRTMFSGCEGLTSVDLSGFDTSKVTNTGGMFSRCKSLTGVDLSGFDTSNVTDMSDMFMSCESLISVDLSGFDTSKVTNMSEMFYGCKRLTGVDVSEFDTSNVTDMNRMFSGCEGLKSVDVSGFDTSNVIDMSSMFSLCRGLTSVDVSGFSTLQMPSVDSMFLGCRSLTSLNLRNFSSNQIDKMEIPEGVTVYQ